MPRGRKPEAEQALSNAERQARYRARRQAQQPQAAIHRRSAADRRSCPQRWRDAVAELLALQADYAAWSDALPESLRDSATAGALQEIIDLDLDGDLAVTEPELGLRPVFHHNDRRTEGHCSSPRWPINWCRRSACG